MDVSQLTDDDSCGLLRAMLTGLQVHGQHAENLQAMLACVLLCYTTLRPHCAVLPQVILRHQEELGCSVYCLCTGHAFPMYCLQLIFAFN
jgi:hypothetical protein